MKTLKTKVSITLDDDLVTQIRQMAEEDDRSFSQYINLVLKTWINQKPHKDSDDEYSNVLDSVMIH